MKFSKEKDVKAQKYEFIKQKTEGKYFLYYKS
jgi:hypothetical protein